MPSCPTLKLPDREVLQFLYVNVAVFRKRHHHRGDAFAAHLVCFVYAKLFAGSVMRGLEHVDLVVVIVTGGKFHCYPQCVLRAGAKCNSQSPTPRMQADDAGTMRAITHQRYTRFLHIAKHGSKTGKGLSQQSRLFPQRSQQ